MASGDTLFERDAQSSFPPSSAAATPDTRNQLPVLDFDAAATEEARFRVTVPRHYASGGITVSLRWAASSATSGNCRWGVAGVQVGDDTDDLDTIAFGTETLANVAAPSASGELSYDDFAVSHANLGSPAAGDELLLRVRRIGGDAGDTMAGDAELVAFEARET